eukprot:3790353-Amphidinium_carterae.1
MLKIDVQYNPNNNYYIHNSKKNLALCKRWQVKLATQKEKKTVEFKVIPRPPWHKPHTCDVTQHFRGVSYAMHVSTCDTKDVTSDNYSMD